MDFSFYLLLTLACMVLLLAMWACAASGTTKWGPDLTLELPPHILQEALFGSTKSVDIKDHRRDPMPSAPSELPCAPLLSNEQPMAMSKPPPPLRTFHPSVTLNMDTAVRVLPPTFESHHKAKPVYYKFSTEESA